MTEALSEIYRYTPRGGIRAMTDYTYNSAGTEAEKKGGGVASLNFPLMSFIPAHPKIEILCFQNR